MDTSDIFDAQQQQQQQTIQPQLQAAIPLPPPPPSLIQQQQQQQQQLQLQQQIQMRQELENLQQQRNMMPQNHHAVVPQQQHHQQQQQQQQQMQCDPSLIISTTIPGETPTTTATQTTLIDTSTLTQMPLQQQQQQHQQQLHQHHHHDTSLFVPSQIQTPTQMTTIQQFKDQPPVNAATNTSNMDIDALLLQQFSCLGTTDHEDLILQFQSLMNNKMNEATARFFLEMSNWNLQTAVGCYLDVCNFQTLPSMKIVQESRPNEEQQAWRLQNDGTESWPNGCYLMSPSQTRRIDIPAIKPGESFVILADMPISQQAVMFRLCTPNGWYFGEPIWIVPPGSCPNPNDLVHRMSQLRTSPNGPICDDVQINIIMTRDME